MSDELNIPRIQGTLGHSETVQPKLKRGKPTGQVAVRYYVKNKRPLAEIPEAERIPPEVEGTPTDIIEIGEVRAQFFHTGVNTGRVRPIQPGYSIGHRDVTAGTLGALVWSPLWKWEGVLSNAHVLANSISIQNPQRAILWDPVLQPGLADGGQMEDMVAFLSKWVPLDEDGDNEVDCALALLVRPVAYRIGAPGLGPVKGKRLAEAGLDVYKVGRTTGLSASKIFDANATIEVGYGPFTARFVHQILVMPSMSQGGDSGSLILDKDNKAIGLLFAGSAQVTLANDIGKVLLSLQIELVGI